ncbi:salicylate hydroxylase [Trichosporon asahii var. asahii CBS 8904]|uniref:Salicylate hydroxylase n=2 Tax=Trichosporon asahii var. asahii TaxID=189963 RepID=K1W7E8_TRIAC|nr:salicylate hydroxylase [Trichosporon asahii var. asahii CBS 2479]EJT45663.1 salicylate hydroxylase [Trichosporon asahii var. asahii CBS 2479]EKD04813.1 salicylate hydroxylase [Trichosporon asahii var. asahii CBS 8904]
MERVPLDNRKTFTLAIVGGGIAGLALAISLYHRGIKVQMYERAAAFGEIGAGVSFTPNALQAMKLCHPDIYEAFLKVCTRNTAPEKSDVFFDYVRGYDPSGHAGEIVFTARNEFGQNAVHRAHFLDEVVKLLPQEGIVEFGKLLTSLEETSEGVTLRFADGSVRHADAVLGCDGIKSAVRRSMFPGHPCANPTYTHKYAYRGLIPIDAATAAVGPELGQNSFMHLGPGGHVLTFPVNHGATLNVVAFYTDPNEWSDHERLTRTGTREQALRDFGTWGEPVRKLLSMCDETLPVWAIFDLGHPAPSFAKGRIAILGDAAHATSPHNGAGAGMGIEDAAVLSAILASDYVTRPKHLQAALQAYDVARRERGLWLVRASRELGKIYDWQGKYGDDMGKIEGQLKDMQKVLFDVNVAQMCEEAIADAAQRIAPRSRL